jgi:phosphoserine phosphatase RsbU/P
MAPEILIRTVDGNTRLLQLEGSVITLGRSRTADICFPDDADLSRQHLVFEKSGDEWFVRDLGSKNGTVVNGDQLAGAHKLGKGDRLVAGRLSIEVSDVGAAPSADVVFVEETGGGSGSVETLVSTLHDALGDQTIVSLPGAGTPLIARRHIEALIRAGRELAGHQPLAELFDTIIALAIDAVQASRGVLLALERDQLVLRASKGGSFRISRVVRDRVLTERASLLVMDTALDEAFRSRVSIIEQKVRSLMAVPLQTSERVIGLIYVDASALGFPFTRDDLNLLTVLANVAAVRIEHERLSEIEQAEKIMSRELEQAAEIQRRLLPGSPPPRPALQLAGYSSTCRTVGGDYYDFFSYSDGSTGLVVGDVAGKGMPAALLMSCLQARVRLLAEEPGPLAAVTARLNRSMLADCPDNRFITFFISRFEPGANRLSYCNAGHNPPLLVFPSGRIEKLETGGPVLGLFPNLEYQEAEVRLEPGSVLLLYSDGVTEAQEAKSGEEFGEDRLIEIITRRGQEPAVEILNSITATLREWMGDTPQQDDVTLMVARCLPD